MQSPTKQEGAWIPVYYVPQHGQQPHPSQNPTAFQQVPSPGYAVDPVYQQMPMQAQVELQSALPHQVPMTTAQFRDSASESSATLADDAGFKRQVSIKKPNVPGKSYALITSEEDKNRPKTNTGNTKIVMALLSEMWIIHLIIILGGVYLMTFVVPQGYTDAEIWNSTAWYKLGWMLPLPYTFVCFFGLILPYRTPKFLYKKNMPRRRVDNLYILTVTKGANKEAVYRAWNAHRHLESLHPCIRVHVLTDEPYFFENINCYTCPKSFVSGKSKYKARALEWYRQTMRFTEHDWILHLDEESVIDDESVKACLEFIWYETDCHWGQGLIMYNQYQYWKFWKGWIFSAADALRVGDDLSRFALQYSYFRRPIFGAHGSFLMTNGLVENAITWDLGSKFIISHFSY